MHLFYRLSFYFLLVIIGLSCEQPAKVGKPIVAFSFNNSLNNAGIATTAIYGPQSVTYAFDKKDTCLDLSINASTRQALAIKLKDDFTFHDYQGFTISCWVKKDPNDPEAYTILSQTQKDSSNWNGWKIKTQKNGSWEWLMADGNQSWNYKPTKKHSINDGQWHHLAFSYNNSAQEARLYHNGRNTAIYSLFNNQLIFNGSSIIIGNDSIGNVTNLFNGQIDDLMIWSRVINADEIKSIYKKRNNKNLANRKIDETLTVLSWNIRDGGIHHGRYVGVQRIIELIKMVNPDIVLLQESNGANIAIADAIGYTFYKRSKDLCLLTRLPITNSHNIFDAKTIGCVELALNKKDRVLVCPIHLSSTPDINQYLKSEEAQVDSIYKWEEATRGKESRFLLSELNQIIRNADQIPIIIGGDFNSGSHLDWTEANKNANNGLVINYPASHNFEKKGFIDSYRQLHTDETTDNGFTLLSTKDNQIENRTCFIQYKGQKLIPIDSYLINEHSKGFPSDHAAVVTTFEWQD